MKELDWTRLAEVPFVGHVYSTVTKEVRYLAQDLILDQMRIWVRVLDMVDYGLRDMVDG